MDKLVIALTYYNAPMMLQEQVKYWKTYPSESVKIILIDDGSMTHPADHAIYKEVFKIPVELYRIKKDIPQNIWGARNLAFHIALVERTEWVLCLDIDHILPSAGVDYFLKERKVLSRSNYYVPSRKRVTEEGLTPLGNHSDSYLLSPELFWSTGGYDEDLTGYYFHGAGFRFRRSLDRVAKRTDLKEMTTHFHPSSIISDASPLENEPKILYSGIIDYKKKPSILNFEWERIL